MEETNTPAAPEPVTIFDGRDFVPVVAPKDESPSPADGKDDAVSHGEDDEPSGADDGKKDDDAGANNAAGADDDAARSERGTAWDQTPENQRAKRFNDQFEHSNRLAKENREYKEKLARYEAGDGPKPTAPKDGAESKAPEASASTDDFDADTFVAQAVAPTADEAKLTESQREVRKLHLEVVNVYRSKMPVAEKAIETASTEVSTIEKQIQRKQDSIAEMKEMMASPGREGLYDSEIQALEAGIDALDRKLVKAGLKLRDAKDAKADVTAEYERTLRSNRSKADKIIDREREQRDRAAEATYIGAERTRLSTVWTKALDGAITELKLPAKLHKAAKRNAFLEVQEINASRPKDKPVTEEEFPTLIRAALKDLAEIAGTASGIEDADEADTRAAATGQPAPKKRTASGSSSDKPMSKDEAFANLSAVQRRVKLRVAS